MPLDRLLRPRSIAIVGASERPSVGRTLVEALDGIGFRGDVYPVNPKYESLLGRRCYPSVADLPRGVDVLAFCVNHARVLEHMQPAADRGVGSAVIFDGGFAEAGAEGRARQDSIAAICLEYPGEDPARRVIAMFLETVREPERFVAALDREAHRGKHVVVLKVGRSD